MRITVEPWGLWHARAWRLLAKQRLWVLQTTPMNLRHCPCGDQLLAETVSGVPPHVAPLCESHNKLRHLLSEQDIDVHCGKTCPTCIFPSETEYRYPCHCSTCEPKSCSTWGSSIRRRSLGRFQGLLATALAMLGHVHLIVLKWFHAKFLELALVKPRDQHLRPPFLTEILDADRTAWASFFSWGFGRLSSVARSFQRVKQS